MLNTIKSIAAVMIMPVLLVVCFKSNQIKASTPNRSPALEVKELTLKQSVQSYLINNAK